MRKNKKMEWGEFITRFDTYEQKFEQDATDPFVMNFYNDFEEIVKDSGFTPYQLSEIKARMEQLESLFTKKKAAIGRNSSNDLSRYDQIKQYINNNNIVKKS